MQNSKNTKSSSTSSDIKWVLYNDPDAAKASFKSKWKSSKPPRAISIQTDDILLEDNEFQTDFSCITNAYSVENEAVANQLVFIIIVIDQHCIHTTVTIQLDTNR
jgi:hypothetical protein